MRNLRGYFNFFKLTEFLWSGSVKIQIFGPLCKMRSTSLQLDKRRKPPRWDYLTSADITEQLWAPRLVELSHLTDEWLSAAQSFDGRRWWYECRPTVSWFLFYPKCSTLVSTLHWSSDPSTVKHRTWTCFSDSGETKPQKKENKELKETKRTTDLKRHKGTTGTDREVKSF